MLLTAICSVLRWRSLLQSVNHYKSMEDKVLREAMQGSVLGILNAFLLFNF
jgi:hypothetical protein